MMSEDPLWTRWLRYAHDDLNNRQRRMISSPQLLRRIVDEETKPLDVKLERAEAALAERTRERDEARETASRLNRRAQSAEAGVAEKIHSGTGPSLGRSLANAGASMFKRERDEALAELARLRERAEALEVENALLHGMMNTQRQARRELEAEQRTLGERLKGSE
jgi:hypothetical protein